MQNLINHANSLLEPINNAQFISHDAATVTILKNFVEIMKITKEMMKIENEARKTPVLQKIPKLESCKN